MKLREEGGGVNALTGSPFRRRIWHAVLIMEPARHLSFEQRAADSRRHGGVPRDEKETKTSDRAKIIK